MSGLGEDFAKYLKYLLRSRYPIEIVGTVKEFTPYWDDFTSFVMDLIDQSFNNKVRRVVEVLYQKPPEVSVVPRSDYYVVYVKNQQNIDDLYLGVNTAYSSMVDGGFFPLLVPVMTSRSVFALARRNINPAVLEELLIILPLIASIPCTDVVKNVKLIKDILVMKYSSYLLNRDLAYNILGYALSTAVNSELMSYRESFERMVEIIVNILERYEVGVSIECVSSSYFSSNVKVYIMFFNSG